MTVPDWMTLLAAFLIGVVAVARATRLVTHDDWPPTMWARVRWFNAVGPRWGNWLMCPYCFAPYAAAVDLAWAVLSDLHWSWWLVNAWAAGAYLASVFVAYDEPPEEDE
jgi:hypothetical protein